MFIDVLLVCLIGSLFGSFFWVNYKLEKEKRRNRILAAFVAGVVRCISDYRSETDRISDAEDIPERSSRLPIPLRYCSGEHILGVSKDFWVEPYEKWLKRDRNLFSDPKYGDDGFNFIYYDFFDKLLREWFSKELMSAKNRAYLQEGVEITESNIGELEGELGMFKDLRDGKLDSASFTPDNFEQKMQAMFPHLKPEKLSEARTAILKKESP